MEILKVSNLVKMFPGVKALDDISMSVEKGEIRGLVGPNGSGKSTLVATIMGFYTPTAGTISFKGEYICRMNVWDRVKKGLNHAHQEALFVPGLSIYRHIELGILINNFPEKDVYKIAELTGLSNSLGEDPGELSVLSARKLEIAKAISTRPEFLLIDECFAGLCYEEGIEIIEIIRHLVEEMKMTILVIDHNLALVKIIAGITTVFDRGSVIAEGSFEKIFDNQAVIDAYMG